MTARSVRARYGDTTITVYQAYAGEIADPALRAGRFVEPFSRNRMTWIKPSFLWMMYRSGWASKPGQERVLAIEITRAGFEWALAQACLSSYVPGHHTDQAQWRQQLTVAPTRVQWDPERDVRLAELPYRSLQLGLSGEAVARYVDEWTVSIEDITPSAHRIGALVAARDYRAAEAHLPAEALYPLPSDIASAIGATG